MTDDVEEVLVTWLSQLYPTANERHNDDPLPFILIRHIGGDESVDEGTADHLVSVRTYCDKSLGADAAAEACRRTHRRMLELASLPDVPLANGRNASVDYVKVFLSPRWDKYVDGYLVKVSRYSIGLAYVD